MASPKMQEITDDYNVLNFDGLNRLAYEKAIHQEDLPYFLKISRNVMHKKYYSSRCLNITENVSFNISSEASYVYHTGFPDRSSLIGQKMPKFKNSNATFLSNFQTL